MRSSMVRLTPMSCALLVACSGSSTHPDEANGPSASSSASSADAAATPQAGALAFESTIVGAPAVDGELVEWVDHDGAVDKILVFATEAGIYFAGELDPGYAGGAYLTIGSKVPPLPLIGEPTRGGGHADLDCVHERDFRDGEYVVTERRLPADIAKKCLEHVAAFEKQKVAHAARFTTRFVIDEKGIGSVDAQGARSAAPGAKLAWKPIDRGATRFEAFVPAAGMPRLSEAPVLSMYFLGSSVGAGKPPAVDEAAPPLTIAPLMFQPHADLRTMFFVRLGAPGYVGDAFINDAGASYTAVDPAHIETWSHLGSGETIEASNGALYEPVLKVGDIEVGNSNVLGPFISILKNGEPVDAFVPFAPVKKIIERGGEIHIVSYREAGHRSLAGYLQSQWLVTIVDKNGAVRDAIDESAFADGQAAAKCSAMYGSIDPGKPTASPNWDVLEWVGTCKTGDPADPKSGEAAFQVTHKWDAAKGQYVGSAKKVPVPKQVAP